MSQPANTWNDKSTATLYSSLNALAVLILIVGLIFAGLSIVELSRNAPFQSSLLLRPLLVFITSLVAAAFLAFCAEVLKLLTAQTHSTLNPFSTSRSSPLVPDERSAALASSAAPKRSDSSAASTLPLAGASPRPLLDSDPSLPADQQILELLRQLRDLAMMSEPQPAQYARLYFEKKKESLIPQIELAISTAQWDAATAHAQELKSILSDDPLGQQMLDRIRAEQAARLNEEVEAANFQIRHLMSVAAWQQAEEIVASLQQKYPYAPQIETLAQDFNREKDAFEAANLQRMVIDIKDASDHRNWKQAISLAQEFIRRYPTEKRADKLRFDLPTLIENAEAQERREEEETFKDLLHRQRYEEALVVAHRVIAKYPASHAAIELAKLIPKVEELLQHEKQKKIVV